MATTGALVLAGSVMLSWVALFNHAPLVFADSLGYATAPLRGEVPGLFSIFYSVLILPLHLGVTLWPVVFVQGAMLAHLLYLTTRCVSDGSISKPETLLIIAGFAFFKPAMDYRSNTAGCVVAGRPVGHVPSRVLRRSTPPRAAFLRERADDGWHRGTFQSCADRIWFDHLVHGPETHFWAEPDRIRQWAALLLIPFVVAVFSMLAVTWVDLRGIGFARNSNVFLLAKWIDEGPALSYLTRACPTAGYALCAHVEELKGLTHDDLKWGWNSPFKKVGTFDELEPEARKIVWATLLAHPFEILQRAMVDAGRQLLRFQAGDGLSQNFARMVAEHLAPVFGPGDREIAY